MDFLWAPQQPPRRVPPLKDDDDGDNPGIPPANSEGFSLCLLNKVKRVSLTSFTGKKVKPSDVVTDSPLFF